jgi:hypothetical protein
MEQPEDKPKTTGGLSKTSPRNTGGLPKTSSLSKRDFPLTQVELYAYFVVLAMVVLSGLVIPQRILDEYEMAFLLLVVLPFLAWSGRIILKSG